MKKQVDDTYLIELYQQGKSYREIGRIVNLEHHSVKTRLINAGQIAETKNSKDNSNFVFPLDKALELYRFGFTCNAIGKELGLDGKVVKKHLIKAGIAFGDAFNKPINLDDKKTKMIELYNRGMNYTDMATFFKTTGPTIKAYLKKFGLVE